MTSCSTRQARRQLRRKALRRPRSRSADRRGSCKTRRVDARAFQDDEVVVDDAPSPGDVLNDETIRRPRPGSVPESIDRFPRPAPASLACSSSPRRIDGHRSECWFWSSRGLPSGWSAGMRSGAGARQPRPAVPRQRRRADRPPAPLPQPPRPATGREFSEQAVTPPAPKASDSAAAGRGGAQTRGAADRRAIGNTGRHAAAPARPAAAASTGTLVVRSTPAGPA